MQAEYVSPFEFDLSIAADASGTQSVVYYSAWFYFGTENFTPNKTYTFNIKSTGKQVVSSISRVSCTKKATCQYLERFQGSRSGPESLGNALI